MEPFDAELLYALIQSEFTVLTLQTHEVDGIVGVKLRMIHEGKPCGCLKYYPRSMLDRLHEEHIRCEILTQIRNAIRNPEIAAE